ncbi:hypothetical protein DFP72DRAFT_1035377 [Ephemerocybe angulata]|uniref:F-box domain-containing protein n=1 Tax=Ephemerocybe angulata TaxID=980116 RepID=A0A8H6HGU2_9AGAR|nr:hypothetical protein DFP72DRAFT_1035377 [Tulosesus angulatus]
MRKCSRLTRVHFVELPLDILSPILESVNDSRYWCVCALVNKTFNRAVTPLLYRNLDPKIISKDRVLHHPATTILKRPELGQYVQHITESGWGEYTQAVIKLLSLCTSLKSLTWSDDSRSRGYALVAFLDVIKTLPHPLEELNIRTHNDPAPEVWEEVYKLEGLKRVSIWCMEGPPRVLQGWCEKLGPTLESLELGRCAGVPPTILIAVLLHLPHLRELRLKGAPASVITGVLAVLPKLKFLDTEYLPSFGRARPASSSSTPPPALESLTVRTSSADFMGPQKLWPWILELIPGPTASLHTFSLHSFVMNVMGKGSISVPGGFLLELSRVHGATLRQVILGDAMLTLGDIECLVDRCVGLEVLSCMTVVSTGKVDMIKKALKGERSLRSLTLQIDWIVGEDGHGTQSPSEPFTLETAREWMLRSEDSSLRHIAVNDRHYTGKWVLQDTDDTQGETRDVGDEEMEALSSQFEALGGVRAPKKELRFVVSTDAHSPSWR